MRTASVINMVMENGIAPPEVGMGCTVLMWTDRQAATITEVGPKTKEGQIAWFKFQRDNTKVTSGSVHDGSAHYSYTPNLKAEVETARLCKDGRYHLPGGVQRSVVRPGIREEYRDPSF